MIDYINCNLTQYTNFRELQLQFLILKQEKQQIFNQFTIVKNLYQVQLNQISQLKKNHLLQYKNQKQQKTFKTKAYQLQNIFQANFQYLNNNFALFDSFQEQVNNQKYKNSYEIYEIKMQKLLQQFTNLKQKQKQSIKNSEQLKKQLLKSNRQKDSSQQLLNEQVQHLRVQIDQLYFTMEQLNKQNKDIKNQNRNLQSHLSELKLQNKNTERNLQIQKNKSQSKQQIQDNNFALDLICFQKDLIQKLYTRVANATKNNQLSDLMNMLYNHYQEIGSLFQQKLQIQYDLQELEAIYKSDKNISIQQNILIQMRKQIQIFRIQLTNQKQRICQKQLEFQNCLTQFQNQWVNQVKLRNFSCEIQKKIDSTRFPLKFGIDKLASSFQNTQQLLKRQVNQRSFNKGDMSVNKKSQNQSIENKTIIKFRGSGNAEEIMKEIVKKDRENLQKILLAGKVSVYNS